MGLFDFLNKPRGYSAWKMQMGQNGRSTSFFINYHVDMLEAFDQVIKNAALHSNPYYLLNVMDYKIDTLGEGFSLDCKFMAEDDMLIRLSYLGTENEHLLKNSLWYGLTDKQISLMENAQYSIVDDDQIAIQYVMRFPYAIPEEDYVIRAFAEEIHQRLPNNDITAGVNGILVSLGGSGKLEFSRHLKR